MKKIYFIAAIALAACNMPNKEKETEQKATVQQYELLEKWESDSLLKVPESVLFDKANQILYVSNIDGTDPWKADGKGSIAKVGLDGKIIAAEWVSGLNAPKGMGIYNGKLYAADLGNIAVIDIASGKIEKNIPIQGATGLNDISIDPNGVIYVTEYLAKKLYKIANEESKELSSVIKDLGKQNLDTQIASLEKQIMQLQSEEQKHISQKQSQEQLIQEVVDNITKLSEQIIPITVKLDNIDSLQYQYTDTRNKIDTNELLVSNLESKLTGVTNELNEYNKKLSSVDIEEINTRVSEAGLLQKSLFELQKEEKKIEMDIHHKEEKLKNLDKLEYDENCSYCMNNIFVKDAIQTKSSLSSDYTTKAQLLERIHTKQNELHTISDFEQKKFAYDKLTAVTSKLNADKLKLENEKLKIENSISNLRVQLNILSNDIGLYEQNKESINKNAHTHSLLLNERAKLANLKLDLQKIEQLLNECLYAQSIHKASQLHMTGQLKRYADLQKEYNYYQLYMNAFSRDGVPYQLISKALPKIEAEINNMLSQIVDYEIMLNTDGKNINAFIVYDPDRYWPIELASGMEKFVASIAIRTALINVSSLPRPPFLVIDEGMGNLDADNLNNMYILFDYLKTQFEYVITISHIESMRDMVDSVIEITKSGEKSLISYT